VAGLVLLVESKPAASLAVDEDWVAVTVRDWGVEHLGIRDFDDWSVGASEFKVQRGRTVGQRARSGPFTGGIRCAELNVSSVCDSNGKVEIGGAAVEDDGDVHVFL
jgi:hypothetical protein